MKIGFCALLVLIMQGCGSGARPANGRQTSMTETQSDVRRLIVIVRPDTLPGGFLKSDLIKVSLTNASRLPVTVAARLSIGYEDSDSREIYALVRDRSSGAVVGKRSLLYEREQMPASQVKILQPDEKIESEFNLRQWYEVPEGDLEIQIVYDPREAARRFPEVQSQMFASEFVPFTTNRKP